MRKLLLFLMLWPSLLFAQGGTPAGGYGPGGSSSAGAAPVPGVTGPPTSGLIGRYELLSTDTVTAITDSSGAGNAGTGTVGTAPTIGATGGIVCNGAGAVSLPAALNGFLTAAFYATLGSPGANNLNQWPLVSGSVAAHSAAIAITNNGNNFFGENDFTSNNGNIVYLAPNETRSTLSTASLLGTNTLIVTFSGTDHVYVNGVENSYIVGPGSSIGAQSQGNLQLCGTASPAYSNNMTIWKVYFYNRVLSANEIQQLNSWLNLLGTNSNIPPSFINPSLVGPILFVHGDSEASGNSNSNVGYATQAVLNPTPAYTTTVRGHSGIGSQQMCEKGNQNIQGMYFNPNGSDNLMFYNLNTNDIRINNRTVAQMMNDNVQCVRYWNSLGGRTIVSSITSFTSANNTNNAQSEAIEAAYNATWRNMPGVVGYADFGNDPNLLGTSVQTNSVFFEQANQLHPNQNGYYNDLTPIYQRAVNRANGNLSWSAANTYTASAAAATATTALTEATNTVTVTFGATPANCLAGSQIVITGVTAGSGTATGYNSTAANGAGPGAWYILTKSATQVTFWDNTSGLGAASVQGTGVCPQQVDPDVYVILGGAAASPNFTLEDCLGYTNQNLYFMVTNTNAGPWTITPFNSSETINGQTSLTTIAATNGNHPVFQLKQIPGAVGTGGCTWQASIQ